MNDIEKFLAHESLHDVPVKERLLAAVWWYQRRGVKSVAFSQVAADNENAGYPSINKTRERQKLRADPRTKALEKGKSFLIVPSAIKDMDARYAGFVDAPVVVKSDTLFEAKEFEGTRNYLVRVIDQINRSYDHQMYDCCAVMIRRLLETLIIEVYENLGRPSEIKNGDGNFMMFSGLLSFLKNDASLNMGRQSKEGLDGFKRIADSSAHNRRYNASKKDIDDKIDGVKLAVVELRQLAFNQ